MLQRIHDTFGKWIVVLILGLISVTFIFWGVGKNFGLSGTAQFAAKVNGEEVPLTEFDRALQARQNQYLEIYRTELPDEVRRELRRAVVDDLVRDTAIKQRVAEQGYRVSDARLLQSIREIPQFQVDGQFSIDVYRGQLLNAGLTPPGFEALQRESLEVGDLQSGIVDSTFLTPAEFRRYIELYNQRREIAYAAFDAEAFSANVTIDDAAIASRYENNQASYQTTETVDLEYIELALADIAATVEVTEEDLRAAYEQERERFETAEERRVRHIQIAVADGKEDEARATAESVIARLRAGEDFVAVAAEVSADAGTKAQGGELGWMGRGTIEGPFEDAFFALQVGEISAPVRTPDAFHIIRVDEIRAGGIQPFEAVREDLAAETKTRQAEDKFYDRANELSDAAFDANDELASVAAATGLAVKTVMAYPRTGDSSAFENNAAVVQAAFADETVDSGRNSELVELAEDHVLVLRVVDHHIPTAKPLEEVRDQVREELLRERGQQLAEEAAQAFFTEIEQGGDPVERATARGGRWNAAAWVMRTDAAVPTEVLSAVFGMPKASSGAPQRDRIALANGGQAVIVLTAVEPGEPATMTQEQRDQRQRQLADQAARAELTGYVGNVRDAADVRIPDDLLNPPTAY